MLIMSSYLAPLDLLAQLSKLCKNLVGVLRETALDISKYIINFTIRGNYICLAIGEFADEAKV